MVDSLDDNKVLFVPGSKKDKMLGRMMIQEQSGEMKKLSWRRMERGDQSLSSLAGT